MSAAENGPDVAVVEAELRQRIEELEVKLANALLVTRMVHAMCATALKISGQEISERES